MASPLTYPELSLIKRGPGRPRKIDVAPEGKPPLLSGGAAAGTRPPPGAILIKAVNKGTTTGPRTLLGPNVLHSQTHLPLLDINSKLLPLPGTIKSAAEEEDDDVDPDECPWISDDLITVFDFLVQFKVGVLACVIRIHHHLHAHP